MIYITFHKRSTARSVFLRYLAYRKLTILESFEDGFLIEDRDSYHEICELLANCTGFRIHSMRTENYIDNFSSVNYS